MSHFFAARAGAVVAEILASDAATPRKAAALDSVAEATAAAKAHNAKAAHAGLAAARTILG